MTDEQKTEALFATLKLAHSMRLMPGPLIICALCMYIQNAREDRRDSPTDEQLLEEVKEFIPLARMLQSKVYR